MNKTLGILIAQPKADADGLRTLYIVAELSEPIGAASTVFNPCNCTVQKSSIHYSA